MVRIFSLSGIIILIGTFGFWIMGNNKLAIIFFILAIPFTFIHYIIEFIWEKLHKNKSLGG